MGAGFTAGVVATGLAGKIVLVTTLGFTIVDVGEIAAAAAFAAAIAAA
jgi:hypothetical protein